MADQHETPNPLSKSDINRYSRQILLDGVGCSGQAALCNASVLVVGAGGLGCPCALYLASSGIRTIGIVDYDQVELNNLHRQILHTEASIGKNKVDSAKNALSAINSKAIVNKYCVQLDSSNATKIIEEYDVVVDATDNVATRYLLNDASFFCKKPLVSGSALQWEGQLTVYNYEGGPCYRCLFPSPPAPETVTNCGEGGVLSVIPGTIGVLQALQVINILLKRPTLSGHLLLFDGSDCSFRRVRLRHKAKNCALCGDTPTLTELIDYEAFCQSKANDKDPRLRLLKEEQRISAVEYHRLQEKPHVLLDVRTEQEFEICKLAGAVSVPIKKVTTEKSVKLIKDTLGGFCEDGVPVYVVCRRGNDSQRAVIALEPLLEGHVIKDIIGGLHAWSREVDNDFPMY